LVVCAVLPLLVPAVWGGLRLALSDDVLAVVAPMTEAPLSARSPVGVWAVLLGIGWFGLAYRSRNLVWWEIGLVLVGGSVALLRVGNSWLDGLLLVAPLARQIHLVRVRPLLLGALAVLCVCVALLLLARLQPPALPAHASAAALATGGSGRVLADWRWAPELQRRFGQTRTVLAGAGLGSESSAFWIDYLRVAQGHERWMQILEQMDVDLVVLDAADQQTAAAALVRASPEWQVLDDRDGALVARRHVP
jgi:hypothetical protein